MSTNLIMKEIEPVKTINVKIALEITDEESNSLLKTHTINSVLYSKLLQYQAQSTFEEHIKSFSDTVSVLWENMFIENTEEYDSTYTDNSEVTELFSDENEDTEDAEIEESDAV